MRTRLVRVRRRSGSVAWALMFLFMAMALYIRVSLPALKEMQAQETTAGHGERVTREVTVDGLSIWLVSFGRYESESAAKVEAARYVPRGAAGYVLADGRFSVIGAGYESRRDAETVCGRLMAEEGIECAAEETAADAVTLRMTAGSEQIAAFLEAEKTLRSTAGALGRLAFSVDRGDASAEQAAEVVGTYLQNVRMAAGRLEKQTGETENRIFDELRVMLDELAGQMEAMTEITGAMAMSGGLKYCYIDFTVREIDWLNGLNAAEN